MKECCFYIEKIGFSEAYEKAVKFCKDLGMTDEKIANNTKQPLNP
jgi:hypothetical protein